MQHTHIENAWLVDAHLDGAFLQGLVATNAVFADATFKGADVGGAHLDHSFNIDCTKLAEAENFMGAQLPANCKAAVAKQVQQEKAFQKSK